MNNLFKTASPTEDEIIERNSQQSVEAEELKIAQLPPEMQEAARAELYRRLMGQSQDIALNRGQTSRQMTKEEEILSQRAAMENYNSEKAKAIRARFSDQPASQETAMPPSILHSKPHLRQPVSIEQQTLMDIRDAAGREQYENTMNSDPLHKKKYETPF